MIRNLLERETATGERSPRDLALFNTAVDTMLRAVDLLALTVADVTDPTRSIHHQLQLRQHKTGKLHLVALNPATRAALAQWIEQAGKARHAPLFTRLKGDQSHPVSRRAYADLVKEWVSLARIPDVKNYSTHSMRRTKAAHVYTMTKNPEVVRQLLGHSSIASTSAYLNISKAEALAIAAKYDL